MRRKVGDTSNCIALHLDVWAQHLSDERLETSQLDDEQLVLSCATARQSHIECGRRGGPTIDGEIAERGTGSPLNLGIMAAEEEENGVQRVPSNLTNFLLRDLGKCKGCAALKVNVLGEGKSREGAERRTGEEIGCGPVCNYDASKHAQLIPDRAAQRANFRGTGGDRRRLRAHSREGVARIRVTGVGLLRAGETSVSLMFTGQPTTHTAVSTAVPHCRRWLAVSVGDV